jgi:probable rRNA maturation factor
MNKLPSIELQYASTALKTKVMTIASEREIAQWAKKCFTNFGRITVRFINKAEAHDLNLFFRGFDKPTNVLTFPYHNKDIVLCMPIVCQEAKMQGKSVKDHLAHLLIHGCLHAQGHDHMSKAQANKMEALEVKLLASIGVSNPY